MCVRCELLISQAEHRMKNWESTSSTDVTGTVQGSKSGLTLSSANYREAINILHKQQIISRHMELLLKVETVSDQNLKSLRQLYDTVESQIQSLKALGIDSASYGALLCPVLLHKLKSDV